MSLHPETQGPEDAPAPAGAAPEALDPESPRYQPWAEKQLTNASKEKRPLAEFLAEFEERIAAQGGVDHPRWDPERNQRALARLTGASATPRRRRRRRPGSAAARAPRPAPSPAAKAAPETSAGRLGARRRRRRGGRGRSRTERPAAQP
ncbi:MAG: hypothetical protein ACREN4_01675 [Candidatus Dormibacteria bacterium]